MTEFTAHLHEVFAGFGPVSIRRMFGGHGIYHDSLMFALVSEESLYLKADQENVHYFTERELPPFEYLRQGKVMKLAYFLAPEEILEEAELATQWARRSYAAALRASAAKRRKGREIR